MSASSDCPICGKSEPHAHAPGEVNEYRERMRREKTESRIITADKLRAEREERRANGGRMHFCTKREAADIAASMGQLVYDKIREQHAASMAELDQALDAALADIRKVIIVNIADLQHRSFSYRVRRDFAFDCDRIVGWVRGKIEALRTRVALFTGLVALLFGSWHDEWPEYEESFAPAEDTLTT